MHKSRPIQGAAILSALLMASGGSYAGVQTTIGHNPDGQDTASFTFTNVPSPCKNDAATDAKFTLVYGRRDRSGGELDKLHDGQVPGEADGPTDNFFLAVGDTGSRIQIDLGKVIEVKQFNSYSWHPNTRGPQVYNLYASDGSAANFVAAPEKEADLAKSGWTLLSKVDTRGKEDGGQYGVSIANSDGTLGKYRYFLMDVSPTETEDPFGNTFFSEIDVVEQNAAVAPITAIVYKPFVFKTTNDYCTISIDTSKAPELKEWAEGTLAPALASWYPRITKYMDSDGWVPPTKFSITISPGEGVAHTAGTRIWGSSTWLAKELKREAIGAILHEVVHVVQQYGGGRGGHRPPNWIIEGIPDYVRFFQCEPETHGADITYFKARPNAKLNYDGLYRVSANFLNYVVDRYDANKTLIAKLNGTCRKGAYTDDFWKEMTGKTLVELNDEWKAAVQNEIKPKQS